MSVLIKGMEMPKSCKDCPCRKFAYNNWDRPYNYCGVTGDVTFVNCPLVEVPTPHGKLIDADEIEKCVHEWYDVGEYVFADTIRNADTIIEAEVSE